jgi:excisionase family DNA binding protein
MDDGEKYLSIERASEYLGLSISYIQKLTSQRRIPFAKIGRRCLYDRALLDRWMARRAVLPRDFAFKKDEARP